MGSGPNPESIHIGRIIRQGQRAKAREWQAPFGGVFGVGFPSSTTSNPRQYRRGLTARCQIYQEGFHFEVLAGLVVAKVTLAFGLLIQPPLTPASPGRGGREDTGPEMILRPTIILQRPGSRKSPHPLENELPGSRPGSGIPRLKS
jgi:hypothetical protein